MQEKTIHPPEETERIDLWAWAVRLYKTRSLAAAACEKSQILVNGQHCRPSRRIRAGDEILIRRPLLEERLEVKAISRRRMAAKEVGTYYEDHTSPEERARAAEIARVNRLSSPKRETGRGRPTKRERRKMKEWDDAISTSHGVQESSVDSESGFSDFVDAFFDGVRKNGKIARSREK